MSSTQSFARWRVPVGYGLAILVLWLARPTPRSIVFGAIFGVLGLLVRAAAAGHLHKQEMLTTSGPYAHTRNPLYFGSIILAVGAAIAANSLLVALLLCAYFAFFYSIAMRLEEQFLRQRHESALDEYVKAVPLFLPSWRPARLSSASAKPFSFAQYKKNREYRAALGFVFLLIVFFLLWWLRQAR